MPQRFSERIKQYLGKHNKISQSVKVRDVSESDTTFIVSDMLTYLLG